MQPLYTTLSSSGASPWKTTNWNCTPQQISFAVLSTGDSSWFIDVAYEDPQNVYPSLNSSLPTAFTVLTGSSNQFFALGSSIVSIAAYRLTVNAPSSAGARVTLVSMQRAWDRSVLYRPLVIAGPLRAAGAPF